MEQFLSNDRLISYYRNRYDVTEFPKDKLNMAYLDEKFEQFLIKLKCDDENLILATLKEIKQELVDGAEVIKFSFLYPKVLNEIIVKLKENQNVSIRIEASLCFVQFCIIDETKQYLHEKQYVKEINKCLDDEDDNVRMNLVLSLNNYSMTRYGQDILIEDEVLLKTIERLFIEKNENIIISLLTLLHNILKAENATKISLNNNIMSILSKHLVTNNIKIQEETLRVYGSLSMMEEGKYVCIDCI